MRFVSVCVFLVEQQLRQHSELCELQPEQAMREMFARKTYIYHHIYLSIRLYSVVHGDAFASNQRYLPTFNSCASFPLCVLSIRAHVVWCREKKNSLNYVRTWKTEISKHQRCAYSSECKNNKIELNNAIYDSISIISNNYKTEFYTFSSRFSFHSLFTHSFDSFYRYSIRKSPQSTKLQFCRAPCSSNIIHLSYRVGEQQFPNSVNYRR